MNRIRSRLMRLFRAGMDKALAQMSKQLDKFDLEGLSKKEVIDQLSNRLPRLIDFVLERSIDELFARPLLITYIVTAVIIAPLSLILFVV